MIQHFPRGIDYRHFHPRSQARVQTNSRFGAGGCSKQEVLQVTGKYLDSVLLSTLTQQRE